MSAPPRLAAYFEREAAIVERATGQNVLHLGFIGEPDRPLDQRLAYVRSERSLDSRLRHVAERVVGVDLDEEAIAYLRQQGPPDVHAGDVEFLERSDVPRSPRFSLIVAGDVIEHLSNPGLMLEGVKSFLEKDGTLIVTAPNAYGLPNYLRFLRGSFREDSEHVQSYTLFTLAHLLARHGWEITEANTCYQSRAATGNALIFRTARWLLERATKLGGTLFFVCRLRTG